MPKGIFEKEPLFNSFKLTYVHEIISKVFLYVHCYLQLLYNEHFRNYPIKNKLYVLNFICENGVSVFPKRMFYLLNKHNVCYVYF